MMQSWHEVIRKHSHELTCRDTSTAARLTQLEGIRAVLFDVYGTLFISASGDIGTADDTRRGNAFRNALDAAGIRHDVLGDQGDACLKAVIHDTHTRARESGIEFPEVDIVAVWNETLTRLESDGLVKTSGMEVETLQRLAIEHEVRANPVWPMPHAVECLTTLHRSGYRLGIVSNAQFFTPELFPALTGHSLESLGFATDLQFYSYQSGRAKPGTWLYERAKEALDQRGIDCDAALYVGNDMLNDITAAQRTGFRTALFAGDARSLRWRDGDNRVTGVSPDIIVTDLMQLPSCLAIQS